MDKLQRSFISNTEQQSCSISGIRNKVKNKDEDHLIIIQIHEKFATPELLIKEDNKYKLNNKNIVNIVTANLLYSLDYKNLFHGNNISYFAKKLSKITTNISGIEIIFVIINSDNNKFLYPKLQFCYKKVYELIIGKEEISKYNSNTGNLYIRNFNNFYSALYPDIESDHYLITYNPNNHNVIIRTIKIFLSCLTYYSGIKVKSSQACSLNRI